MPNSSSSDARLIELAEESTYAYQMTYASLPGGERGVSAEYSWYCAGVPGEFFNGITYTTFPQEGLADKVQAALRPFQERGLPVRWYLGPSSRPAGLETALAQAGLRFSWSGPALAIDLADLRRPESASDGLEIRVVDNPDDLAAWIGIFVKDAPAAVKERLSKVYTISNYGADLQVHLYLAAVDGKPAASAAMYHGCAAAAVKHVATLPEFQQRGIATALTLRALDDALALGCHYAALTSSTQGFPVYQRLGFREVCRFTRFVWEPDR